MIRRTLVALAAAALAVPALAACGGEDDPAASGKGTPLVGTFRFDPGACTAQGAEGSYFRMVNRGGTVAKGPYFGNPDSPCADKSFTPQAVGKDGGLVTGGGYQPAPTPPFDRTGNARSGRIFVPGSFTAIKFGISTEKEDPVTGTANPAPELYVADGRITGQLTAWTASWNNLYFNQGSPKPGGGSPGETAPVSGTYDEATGEFVLEWASQVVGGPFNGFAGYWHLTGTFTRA